MTARDRGLLVGTFRVIGVTRAGRVRILKGFRHSSMALRYFGLACVSGAFQRVELQTYELLLGWIHTTPRRSWGLGEPPPAEELPLFAAVDSRPARGERNDFPPWRLI